MFATRTKLLAVAVVCGLACGQLANAQNEPGPTFVAPMAAVNDDLPERDLILFAGGAVEFELPRGWSAAEVPYAREIRLLMTPGLGIPGPRSTDDVIWVSYRFHGRPVSSQEIDQLLVERVRQIEGRAAKIGVLPDLKIAGHSAPAVSFRRAGVRGLHAAVVTELAVVEFHLAARDGDYDGRLATFNEIGGQMVLERNARRQANVKPPWADAANAIGLWKGLRGRMRLSGDGRVVVRFDAHQQYTLDSAGRIDYDRPTEQLTGKFQAEGDLLMITWDDGSQLNYRWALDEGDLMLTDHYGRVSQLRRHFD